MRMTDTRGLRQNIWLMLVLAGGLALSGRGYAQTAEPAADAPAVAPAAAPVEAPAKAEAPASAEVPASAATPDQQVTQLQEILRTQVSELMRQRDEALKARVDLAGDIARKDETIRGLQQKITALEKTAAEYSEQQRKAIEERRQYEAVKTKELEDTRAARNQSVSELQQQLGAAKESVRSSQEQLAATKKTITDFNEQQRKLLEEHRKYEEEIQGYLSQVKTKDKELDDTRKAMKDQAADLQAQLNRAEETIRNLTAQNEQIRKESKLYVDEVNKYETRLAQVDETIKAGRQTLQEKVQRLEADLTKIRQTSAKQEEEGKKLQAESSRLKEEVNTLVGEKKQLLARLLQQEGGKPSADSWLTENPQALASASAEVDLVKQEFTDLQRLLKDAQQEIVSLRGDNERLKSENTAFGQKAQEAESRNAGFKKQVAEAEKRLRDKEGEYTAGLERSRRDIDTQLKEFRNLAKQLEKENALYTKDKEMYMKQVEEANQRTAALQEQHLLVQKERDALQRQLKSKHRDQRSQENEVKEQQQLVARYSQTIDELNKSLAEVKEENGRLSLLIKGIPEKLSQLEADVNQLRLKNAGLHYNLGVFHTQRQEYTQAVDDFEQTLKYNQNDPNAHYNLGVIYSRYLINESKAVTHFKHYLALSPNDKDAERAKEFILLWGTKEGAR